MAADDEAALRGIALRWPACGAPGAAGRPAKLPCGEHPRKEPRSPSRVPGRCIAAGTGVPHPLFLIPLPQRGRGSRRGGDAPRKRSRRKSGDAPRGSRWRQRPPSPSPLPPRGEGKKNAHHAGMTAVGRPAAACHPRAWPLHGGRDARRASPFPDSSPPTGESIKERGTLRASAVEGRAGTHPEARGGASGPPSPSPLPPRGEGKKNAHRPRG